MNATAEQNQPPAVYSSKCVYCKKEFPSETRIFVCHNCLKKELNTLWDNWKPIRDLH